MGFSTDIGDDFCSNTQLLFVTESMLLSKLREDPLLTKYSVVILDKVDERNIIMDLCIGMLKQTTQTRKDLKFSPPVSVHVPTYVNISIQKFEKHCMSRVRSF